VFFERLYGLPRSFTGDARRFAREWARGFAPAEGAIR
jgi:hypothetical protein